MRQRARVQLLPNARPRIIGLDTSLRALGVAAVSGDPRCTVGAGLDAETALFRAGEDCIGPERLSVLTTALWQWIRSRGAGRPGDLYAVEGYGFSSLRAHSLGEIGGCIRRVIYESGGNLLVIPPTTLKKFLTGSGASEKNVCIKDVFKQWAFDVNDDNECDAFGCSLLGLIDTLERDVWTKVERQILTEKVERYAGKGQEDWARGREARPVAKRARRHRGGLARVGSSVLGEDSQGA